MVTILKKINSKTGRALHRWIGVLVALYVLMATVSGLIHIVVANFYAPPPPVTPQALVHLGQASLPLASIVKALSVSSTEIKAVNLRTIAGQLWYQFIVEDRKQPIYVNAVTGKEEKHVDELYARQIAEEYLQKKEAITKTDYLTSFNKEYSNNYKVLPVYRFDVSDANGERIYVSTVTGNITLYLNNFRAFGQYTFSNLHKLKFIPNRFVRDIVQTVFIIAVLTMTVIGVGLFLARYVKKKG